MMLDQGQAYSHSITAETFSGMNSSTTSSSSSSIRKKKNKNKRRFSDEQIRSLESIFQSESRLEPRKKLQLATELGLQPRQVAIWFQNKRARWKSKQLEREYCMLRANYNTLASKFEALKKEKQALIKQLQKMNELIESPIEEIHCYKQAVSRKSIDRESDSEQQQTHKLESDSEQQTHKLESDSEQQTHKLESEVKPSWSLEKKEHGLGILSDDDDDSTKKAEYFGLEDEPNLINMVEPGDGSMTSPEDWGSLNSDGLFDESSSSYQWWDFWS